jgi:alcohol dehydrogenase YqhD (iron-dependent ADH family)
MKEITLKIPDTKFRFLMELFNQLGIEVLQNDYTIPEEHKEIVRERLKNAKDEDFTPWEEARKKTQI